MHVCHEAVNLKSHSGKERKGKRKDGFKPLQYMLSDLTIHITMQIQAITVLKN